MFFGGAGDLIDGLNGNLIIILKTMFHRKRKHVGQRSKYAKIPAKTKLMFLRKVIQEGFSIRDASTIFNINYSTAKTLIRQHKASNSLLDLAPITDQLDPLFNDLLRIRCSYRDVRVDSEEKVEASSNGTSFYLSGSQEEGSGREQPQRWVFENVKRVEIVSSCNFHK